jgi:hypothetical protein
MKKTTRDNIFGTALIILFIAAACCVVWLWVPGFLIKAWLLYVGPGIWLLRVFSGWHSEWKTLRNGCSLGKENRFAGFLTFLLGFAAGPVAWIIAVAYSFSLHILKIDPRNNNIGAYLGRKEWERKLEADRPRHEEALRLRAEQDPFRNL